MKHVMNCWIYFAQSKDKSEVFADAKQINSPDILRQKIYYIKHHISYRVKSYKHSHISKCEYGFHICTVIYS